MYDPDKCDLCGECLESCTYLDFSLDQAKAAMEALAAGEHPDWLDSCVTCFACTERCKKGADPFALICQRQEESGTYVDPEMFAGVKAHFSPPEGGFTPPKVEGDLLDACTIYNPARESFESRVFESLPMVRGRHYFCNVLYMHMGNLSVVRQGLSRFVGRLSATGAGRVILPHEDCYAALLMAREQGIDIPFTPVHLYEYLLEYLEKNEADITPLGMTIAYQRPCAARYTGGRDDLADKLFEKIGVTRAQRKYDRKNALCCGLNPVGALPSRKGMGPVQDANVADAKESGATAMVFLCPMCKEALKQKCAENGLTPLFVVDLLRAALGEKELLGG
ncbi:MAG: (Fe-S)-binding protein [Deltaproteobacteria bacterium]|nr:(Fe-S)-binding protein [Deltaproteobacteria bacterium]